MLGATFFAKFGDKCALPDSGTHSFFHIPHWWEYLTGTQGPLGVKDCIPHIDLSNNPAGIWLIGLAVLDMLLWLAGFLAVVSIIVAGVQLITAEGNPEKGKSARNRLINSLIGLAIAVSATGLVTLIGNQVQGQAVNGLPHVGAGPTHLQSIFNAAFAIFGALAFLFIVIAGLRYILQGNNPEKVAEARRQIAYAAAGIILIALAATIVNFVLGKLGS